MRLRQYVKTLTADEAAEHLRLLLPDETDWQRLEVAEAHAARQAVATPSAAQRLLIASVAEPVLFDAIVQSFGHEWPDPHPVCRFMQEGFPPSGAIPPLDAAWLAPLAAIAAGLPGERPARHAIPACVTKIARLALARAGASDAATVLDAARFAYDRQHPRPTRFYHAHDAVACAFAHANITPHEKAALAAHLEPLLQGSHLGHKAHRKLFGVLRWARTFGYLDAPT